MDITHTTTDHPESHTNHTHVYGNNFDVNLSSPGIDKQFVYYEQGLYELQPCAESLQFCDNALDSQIDMYYGAIEYCTSWDNNVSSGLPLGGSFPTDSPWDDCGNGGGQLSNSSVHLLSSLSGNLCLSLYADLPFSTASYTSSQTPSLPYESASAPAPSSSYAPTPDCLARSTASPRFLLSENNSSLLPSQFTSPPSPVLSIRSQMLGAHESWRASMTSIDEKQDEEASASLMSTDLLSLPVNSRKRRRSALKETDERRIIDDSDYNPRKLHRSGPPKKQRKVQKTEAKPQAPTKPKIIKAKRKGHTSAHRRVVCNHRGCRSSFSRSADRIRHCETVHGIFTNRDKKDTACYKCGKVLSRADAKQRHELTCFAGVLNNKPLGEGRPLRRQRKQPC